jgi:hypothetical protein
MRRFGMWAAVALLGFGLAGCFPIGDGPLQTPPSPGTDAGVTEDWTSLPHCENGPPDPWVLVDDFPVDLIKAAGLQAECGDTYATTDLPPYVSIADSSVALGELEALATELEAAGFRRTEDNFEPADGSTAPGGVGGWEYTLLGAKADDVTLIYVVNFWPGATPGSYFTYVDFESASTRALRG